MNIIQKRIRLIAVSLLLFAIATAPACFDTPIDWPQVAQCGPQVDDLFPVVSRILLANGPLDTSDPARLAETISDQAADELDRLAREHGPDALACIIDALVSEWTAPGASPDPTRLHAAARGRGYLDDRGVERVKRE